MSMLAQTLVFLSAAVIAVPIAKHIGLGSVLGYLIAGMVIGPCVLNLVGDLDSILHIAELGVVLLLFVVGLELQPSRLWVMRKAVFGLGTAQVLVTTLLLFAVALMLGLPWPVAWIVGSSLSLSSTAFVLQLLAEHHQLTSHHGRDAFSILLFQDLAVIPALALIPILPGAMASGEMGVFDGIAAIATVTAVVVGGRFLLRPLLKMIAATKIHELFTAMSLLIVLATAYAMQTAGLSMALGAFLAGVLLADSEFRHELEADITPFKGLLLGLFFIAVGASVNLHLIPIQPLQIGLMVCGLVMVKTIAMLLVCRIAGLPGIVSIRLSFLLSQGGEFAFVLFTSAMRASLIDDTLADEMILVVTLSMITTPILVQVLEKLLKHLPAEPQH